MNGLFLNFYLMYLCDNLLFVFGEGGENKNPYSCHAICQIGVHLSHEHAPPPLTFILSINRS